MFLSQTIDSYVGVYCDVSGRNWSIVPENIVTSDTADVVIVKPHLKEMLYAIKVSIVLGGSSAP